MMKNPFNSNVIYTVCSVILFLFSETLLANSSASAAPTQCSSQSICNISPYGTAQISMPGGKQNVKVQCNSLTASGSPPSIAFSYNSPNNQVNFQSQTSVISSYSWSTSGKIQGVSSYACPYNCQAYMGGGVCAGAPMNACGGGPSGPIVTSYTGYTLSLTNLASTAVSIVCVQQ